MPIAVQNTAQLMAVYYTTLGAWIGVCKGVPGTSSTPLNEASGGSPAYSRVETTWGGASTEVGGLMQGSPVTVNLPFGDYDYILLASAQTGNTMIDCAPITVKRLWEQGTLVIEPFYSQN